MVHKCTDKEEKRTTAFLSERRSSFHWFEDFLSSFRMISEQVNHLGFTNEPLLFEATRVKHFAPLSSSAGVFSTPTSTNQQIQYDELGVCERILSLFTSFL
jgi:hypothetical protein